MSSAFHPADSGSKAVARDAFCVTEPYRPRRVQYLGIRPLGDWRLKMYGIVYGARPLDESAYVDAFASADLLLPHPAITSTRPGVGFVILHQGRSMHYLVLCWWDNENEVPIRVFVKPLDANGWRQANSHESVCVWDLQVIGFERDAYVQHVLNGSRKDVEGYIGAIYRGES